MSRKPLYDHADVPVGKSMTKQSGAMTPADHFRAYVAGTPLPEAPPPVYGDISDFDYEARRNQIAEFNSHFESLGAELRERFGNDPANYLEYLTENEERIASDGLRAVLTDDLSKSDPEEPAPGDVDLAQTEGTEDEPAPDQTS